MTSSVVDVNVTPVLEESKHEEQVADIDEAHSNDSCHSNKSTESLTCLRCQKDFGDRDELYTHLRVHIQLPAIILQRVDDFPVSKPARLKKLTPLKLTLKSKDNNFTIIKSPTGPDASVPEPESISGQRIPKLRILLPEQLSGQALEHPQKPAAHSQHSDENASRAVTPSEQTVCNGDSSGAAAEMVELHSLPSESQSPSFPGPSPTQPDVNDPTADDNSLWPEQPTDDPLQLTQSGEKEAETHNNLLQNFLNDTTEASTKESVLSSNETEYISLERLAGPQCPVCGERCLDQASLDVHQKAMGHYANNSLVPYSAGGGGASGAGVSLPPSPLESLANLPMQQLAQQVNRLQQGPVHQQNVLINIQQFGQPMAHPQFRPPEMPHYPPQQHYGPQQPQPPPPPPHLYGMPPTSAYHQPGPPHPIYYPPTSGMYPPSQHHQFSPPHHQPMMPPRPPPPRMPQQRMPPPPPPPAAQQPSPPMRARMRAPPSQQARAAGPRMQGARPPQPRAPTAQPQNRPLRRIAPMPNDTSVKKKRLDVLIPDTNDNDDCHVISMQKCNDGLPIIKNVQGATQPTDSDPVVHLTDSITLSVRNPSKEAPVIQKKNDAKAVANILATRGITVTPAAKTQKEPSEAKKPAKPQSPPVAINLNNAVSIIPTARSAQQSRSSDRPARPPTVDLTDDEPQSAPSPPAQKQPAPGAGNKRSLPHLCDLCPAQYPTLQSLMNHRRTYHKAGAHELGVPVIDLKQPAVLAKLVSLGIQSYIPLPQLSSPASTFALPVVSINSARNPNICNISALGSSALLPLGPLRHISSLPNPKH